MGTTTTSIGSCPNCGTRIPEYRVLIEYETTDGPDQFASCPACEGVVTPS